MFSTFAMEYPNAAKVVTESFYVDDCLTGSDTPEGAIELHHKLNSLQWPKQSKVNSASTSEEA